MTFLEEVARALVVAGRSVDLDPGLSTIDVSHGSGGRLLAVVRPVARAVTFYVVHPTFVPAGAVPAVTELLVRATADLLDAALELDLATAAVATRFGVVLGELDLTAEQLGALLDAALETVEAAAARYAGAVDDVSGGAEPATAASAVRRADVEELAAGLDG